MCADAGDQDAALSWYRQAAERVPEYEPAWFNMGLVHKRRRQWADALDCNQRAAALGGAEGDPAWWNLVIAATALRRWDIARDAWRRFGVTISGGSGELAMDLGPAPVRIDPDGHAEVVWGRRILEVQVTVTEEADAQALTETFEHAGYAAQDWTTTIRNICKRCSEGQPSEGHNHPPAQYAAARRFGLAATEEQATRLLREWAAARPGHRDHDDPAIVG